jgi:hypothetical protein
VRGPDLALNGFEFTDGDRGLRVDLTSLPPGPWTSRDEEVQLVAGVLRRRGDLVFAGAGNQLDLVAEVLQVLLRLGADRIDLDGFRVRDLLELGLHGHQLGEGGVDAFGLEEDRHLSGDQAQGVGDLPGLRLTVRP